MAYVITQNCCNDASCIAACPVGCIHPAPGEPGFATTDMLYIDPGTCIDCGACADACPVDAIRPEAELTPAMRPFAQLNADHYRRHPPGPAFVRTPRPRELVTSSNPLVVAIVGSGAAGLYCAEDLLRNPGVRVEMYERLSVPHGLIRHGVAPDHTATKKVVEQFDFPPEKRKRFNLHLGVEVGTDISHAELLERHHAVIYAHGAGDHKMLGVPGESLPGVIHADAFAGWYNDHPDHRALVPDLGARRAVVIGNGNVALDIARILATDPQRLVTTGISAAALNVLRHSRIEEITVLGRRRPEHASFTTPELIGITQRPDIDLCVEPGDLATELSHSDASRTRLALLAAAAARPRTPGNRRIVLRFNTTTTRISGVDTVTGVETEHPDAGTERLETTLVIPAVGFRGHPVPGVEFSLDTHTIPNDRGRVVDRSGATVPGVYTAGWIKRGPIGVIGTNRTCAEETVAQLLSDHNAGALTAPVTRGRYVSRSLSAVIRRSKSIG